MCIVISNPKLLFAHIGVRTARDPKCCVPSDPSLAISRKISSLSSIMFNSLMLELI